MSTTWTRQALNAANEATSTSSPSTEWSRIQIVSSAGGGNLTINDVIILQILLEQVVYLI